MGLITVSESQALLDDELYPEWDNLDDVFMQDYIDRASAYVQLSWSFPSDTNFDWADDTTWIAGTKDVIAKYANAVREGLIYAQGTPGVDSSAPIKKKQYKLGSLELSSEYAQPDTATAKRTVRDLNDQMIVLGYVSVSTKGLLRRV